MLGLSRLTQQISRSLWWRTAWSPCFPCVQTAQKCQQRLPALQQMGSWFSNKTQLTEGEKVIIEKLKSSFPGAKTIEVSDISGGCGAMYQISIEADEFRGKRTVMQHRLVNEALAEEIKLMHGLQLNTKVPPDS